MSSFEIATIDDAGTQLAFLDSGPPQNETYSTLVIVHGHTYHAQNFTKLFPVAQKQNLRIIALNRRDYTGSTPFSSEELSIINGRDNEAHSSFMIARGLEIARFLVWVITEKSIPIAGGDGKEGGLALLGWSLGNLTAMAFLRHLESYPSEVIETIRPYLKTFYVYECGSGTLGYPSPPGGHHPLNDTSIQPRMRGIYFGTWVSSYYKHPYYSSNRTPDDRNISSLIVRSPEHTQSFRPSTLDTISPTDLIKCVDPVPPARSEQPFMSSISKDVIYDLTMGGFLLDYNHEKEPETPSVQEDSTSTDSQSSLLPDIRIRVVYGDSSIWSITWCVWELEKDLEKWKKEGRKIRDVSFLPVAGANHFLHWDDPDLFLKVVRDGLAR